MSFSGGDSYKQDLLIASQEDGSVFDSPDTSAGTKRGSSRPIDVPDGPNDLEDVPFASSIEGGSYNSPMGEYWLQSFLLSCW